MSEHRERPAHFERDLGRANWQRSVATVVMRELTEPIYSQPTELPEDQLIECEQWALKSPISSDLPWNRAYAVAAKAFHRGYWTQKAPLPKPPKALRTQVEQYTFGSDIAFVLEEGLTTQARFPITLARSIAHQAESLGIEEFRVANLSDVASILRRPDFREMIDASLLVANGFWASLATQTNVLITDELFEAAPFAFQGDGTVGFGPKMIIEMRDHIRAANKSGDNHDLRIEKQSSSGCPARHLRPSFSAEEGAANLARLSKYLKKAPEELTRVGEQNLVQGGLKFVASALDKYSDWFTSVDEAYAAGHKPYQVAYVALGRMAVPEFDA